MKTLFISALVMSFLFNGCNSDTSKKETKSEKESTANEQLYACAMHPEVTGKKNDKCSKCGMKLTELVKNADTPQKP